jgi:hypothetical protein
MAAQKQKNEIANKSVPGFWRKPLPFIWILPNCSAALLGCRRGGIGRRARLKIWFPYGSVGSTPSAGTNQMKRLNYIFTAHSCRSVNFEKSGEKVTIKDLSCTSEQ